MNDGFSFDESGELNSASLHRQAEPIMALLSTFLNFDIAIVPARFNALAIETCWAEDATDNLMVELKSVGGDQRDRFDIHALGYVLKEGQRVSVTSPPDDCRRPEPGPDLDHGKDPDLLVLAANQCANFVGLSERAERGLTTPSY